MATIKFRDPVHNFIHFSSEEVKLINSGVIQRLRGIRQLAMACLVYPGALHTRFDHTLGVAHVAGQMAHELGLDEEERGLVRQAALLHDVGHGPFSHISESALDRYGDRDSIPADLKKEKIHEVVTGHIIQTDHDLVRILGAERCERIAKLLAKGVGDPILRSIVSGPLDADKQDYLLRDSKFAGVNYGIFDIGQLHRSLTTETLDEQKELLIRPHGVHAVEQFVMAKYYLTTMVYRHKVRLITDQMFLRAIILGVEKDGNKDLHSLYAFKNDSAFYENYLKWHDAKFMLKFGEEGHPGAKCTQLLDRLTKRNLLKQVLACPIGEFPGETREKIMDIIKPENAKLRSAIETKIAEELAKQTGAPVDPDFTVLHAYQIKSVRESSRNDEASILVSKKPLPPRPFEEESVLFFSINEKLSDKYVEVYAPVHWADHSERTSKLRVIIPLIKDIIVTTIGTTQTGETK